MLNFALDSGPQLQSHYFLGPCAVNLVATISTWNQYTLNKLQTHFPDHYSHISSTQKLLCFMVQMEHYHHHRKFYWTALSQDIIFPLKTFISPPFLTIFLTRIKSTETMWAVINLFFPLPQERATIFSSGENCFYLTSQNKAVLIIKNDQAQKFKIIINEKCEGDSVGVNVDFSPNHLYNL